MAYNPTNWQNGVTKLNENNLNKIEQQLVVVDKSLKYNGNAPNDLNNARTFGIYYCNNQYNNEPPVGGGGNLVNIYGILIVYESKGQTWTPSGSASSGNSWIWQEFRQTNGDIWRRCAVNTESSWSNWKKIMQMDDTGWKVASYNTDLFELHPNNTEFFPRYRKAGDIVELRGVLTPKADMDSTSSKKLLTLPNGYRPSIPILQSCVGSGMNTWRFRINSNGDVTIENYGSGSSAQTISAGAFLPFQITFFTN